MQKHPFERVATPYQVYQWASPMLDHTVDAIRAEDSKLCYFINDSIIFDIMIYI